MNPRPHSTVSVLSPDAQQPSTDLDVRQAERDRLAQLLGRLLARYWLRSREHPTSSDLRKAAQAEKD
jgi:hypothetical protein